VQTALMNLQSTWRHLELQLGGALSPEEYRLMDSLEVHLEPAWMNQNGVDDVYKKTLEKNIEIQLALTEQKEAELKQSSAKSNLYPKIDLTGSWNLGASEADLSNPAESNSSSFQVGAFLKWNLFNGLSDNTLLEKAKIQERTATLKLEKLRLSLRTQVADAIDKHLRALKSLELAQSNLKLSAEIITLAEDQLKVGGITAFEFRENQNRWNLTYKAVLLAKIEAQIAENEILLLMGWY